MRKSPSPPPDYQQAEWERPKTLSEWARHVRRIPMLRERMVQFTLDLIYKAQSDLCYMDYGLRERPRPIVMAAIEFVADRLEERPVQSAALISALWLCQDEFYADPWETVYKALATMGVLAPEAAA